jgi:hypothetical protein
MFSHIRKNFLHRCSSKVETTTEYKHESTVNNVRNFLSQCFPARAVSDVSMNAWMGYLYQQQPMPTDAEGVNVTISVLDPNNNCYDVGTTTSDINGFYKLTFTPHVLGVYTVYATFAGSGSYYGSYALTAINVEAAPAATPAPTPQPASLADIYFLPMSKVILIAIVIATIVMVLMLRKR